VAQDATSRQASSVETTPPAVLRRAFVTGVLLGRERGRTERHTLTTISVHDEASDTASLAGLANSARRPQREESRGSGRPAGRSPSGTASEAIDEPSHDRICSVILALVCLTAGLIGLCAGVFLLRNREVVSPKFSVAAGVVVIVGSLVPLLLGAVVLLVTAAPGISIS
jgi:hypothetical protein